MQGWAGVKGKTQTVHMTEKNISNKEKKEINKFLKIFITILISTHKGINCYRNAHNQAESSWMILTSFW